MLNTKNLCDENIKHSDIKASNFNVYSKPIYQVLNWLKGTVSCEGKKMWSKKISD